MTASTSPKVERPDHVPADLVVDFDCFTLTADDGDVQKQWYELGQKTPGLFWTPYNGGHWVATRAETIHVIQSDHERFSMAEQVIPKGRRGIPTPPLDLDPPEHFKYRKIIAPFFLPKGIKQIEDSIHEVMQEIVDRVAPLGECEFMADVARHLPIIVFLRLMGLPLEQREMLLELAEAYSGATRLEDSQQARLNMRAYMIEQIEDRRKNPQDDLLTAVVQSRIDGEPISEEMLQGMCTLLLSGGLDTVKSMLGFTARSLAIHPEQRRQLVENPEMIPDVVEEFIRRQGITNTARLITRDFEFNGVQFKAGDQVQIPNCLAGLDSDWNENPLELNFNRPQPIKHAAFGYGPHLCPGAALARTELRIFLQYWLKAIPEFELKAGARPTVRVGMTNTIQNVYLVWNV